MFTEEVKKKVEDIISAIWKKAETARKTNEVVSAHNKTEDNKVLQITKIFENGLFLMNLTFNPYVFPDDSDILTSN